MLHDHLVHGDSEEATISEINDLYLSKTKKIPEQFLVLEQQYQYDLHQVWPAKQTQNESLTTIKAKA